MRTVLNLSLPPKAAEGIKKRAKKRGFASTSGYIRFLLDLDDELISPVELLKMAKRADRDYKKGKLIQADSLAELL